MTRKYLMVSIVAGLLVGTFAAPPRVGAASDFKIIVNRQNAVTSLTRQDASNFFLKRQTEWGDGLKAIPADQAASNAIREGFSQAIHGKPMRAIRSYWQTQIFAGRNVPPPELANDAAVVTFVKNTPGAIGYVGADADTGEVKEVIVAD